MGVLPTGKEVKQKAAKKEGDTLKRIASAGAENTIGRDTSKGGGR